MKYTKKQRHEIYKKALSLIGTTVKTTEITCLCWALSQSIYEPFAKESLSLNEIIRTRLDCPLFEYNKLWVDKTESYKPFYPLFPEFELFEPDDMPKVFWFEDVDQRKFVLEFMIYMTA